LSSLLGLSLFFKKLEIKAEQDLPGTDRRKGKRVGEGAGGRNDPNNACTCE
jgi:hypothetical protein